MVLIPTPQYRKWSDKLMGVTKAPVTPGSISPYGASRLCLRPWVGMRKACVPGRRRRRPENTTQKQPGVVVGKDGMVEPAVAAKLIAAGTIEQNEVGPWEVTALMMAVGMVRTRGAYPLFPEEEKQFLRSRESGNRFRD